MSSKDHFAWLDDLVKRWPIIVLIFGIVGWMTRIQWQQDAMANDIKGVPQLTESVNEINGKLDALLEGLGYEVRLKAVKKEDA